MDWVDDLRVAGDRAVRLETDLEFFAAELLKIRPIRHREWLSGLDVC